MKTIFIRPSLLLLSTLSVFCSETEKHKPILNDEEQQELYSLLYDDNASSSFPKNETEEPHNRAKLSKKSQKELFKLCRIPNSIDEPADAHAIFKFSLYLNEDMNQLLVEADKKMVLPLEGESTPEDMFAKKRFLAQEVLADNPSTKVWLKEKKIFEICGQRNRPEQGSNLIERLEHFLKIAQRRAVVQITSFPEFYAKKFSGVTGTTFEAVKRGLRLYANRILKAETDNSIGDAEIWAALLIKQEQLLMFTSQALDKIKKNKRFCDAKILF